MLRYKINNQGLDEGSSILIDLNTEFGYENHEHSYERFINEQALNVVNPIFDNELTYFSPLGFNDIEINLKDNGNTLFYSDIGFNNTDLSSLTNRFINSFLRINFYTSKDPSNQVLFYQVDLNNQISNDADLLVDQQAVKYKIYNPNSNIGKQVNSLGYKVPFFKNPNNYTFPVSLYAEFQYLNAINGQIIRFISSNDVITFNNLYSKLYVKYNLNKINDTFVYTIDSSDRLISNVANNLVINLNILNVL